MSLRPSSPGWPARDDDAYSGVRVSMDAQLATARPRFHVDVNVGDPIRPAPRPVHIPGLLGGEVVMLGYPLAMVHAEKVVTAISRGSFNTRWRDFADICLLSRHHGVDGTELVESIRHVAGHRRIELLALAGRLDGYGDIGQERWVAWRRKQRVEDRLPERFTEVVSAVVAFADPAIAGTVEARAWDPNAGAWS